MRNCSSFPSHSPPLFFISYCRMTNFSHWQYNCEISKWMKKSFDSVQINCYISRWQSTRATHYSRFFYEISTIFLLFMQSHFTFLYNLLESVICALFYRSNNDDRLKLTSTNRLRKKMKIFEIFLKVIFKLLKFVQLDLRWRQWKFNSVQ